MIHKLHSSILWDVTQIYLSEMWLIQSITSFVGFPSCTCLSLCLSRPQMLNNTFWLFPIPVIFSGSFPYLSWSRILRRSNWSWWEASIVAIDSTVILDENPEYCQTTITTSLYSILPPQGQLPILTESQSSCDYFQVSGILLVCFLFSITQIRECSIWNGVHFSVWY